MQKTFFHSDKIKAFFTTRQNWNSSSSFNSLNLGFHVWDNPKNVIKNHEILLKKLWVQKLAFMEQTHSDNIQIVSKEWVYKNTDALITNQKNLAILVMVGDCVPIVYFDPVEQIVAVAHAGRMGTFLWISNKVIKKMWSEFWCKPENILVSIWPSIWSCCYEVWKDIANQFLERFWEYSVFVRGWKYFLDLAEINFGEFLKFWISEKNIEKSNICTCCDNNYFSYRRDWETWRFGWVICLKE